mgnify:CR=1 FL=1
MEEKKRKIKHYLKIDVDGIEYKIIKKSKKLLKNKNLYSILIEINPNREKDNEIIETLLKYGFVFDKQQVIKSTKKTGKHKGYAEYLFFREKSI